MKRRTINIGDRVGRWLIVGKSEHRKYHVKAICDCGTERDVATDTLKKGRSMSCGCLSSEKSSSRMAGRNNTAGKPLSAETKVKLSIAVSEKHKAGCFETAEVKESLQRLHEFLQGRAATGVNAQGPENQAGRDFRLRSPAGNVVEGRNIRNFVRENSGMFNSKDVSWKVGKYGRPASCNATSCLSKVRTGGLKSWKGWTKA